jgi:hypothetical protein
MWPVEGGLAKRGICGQERDGWPREGCVAWQHYGFESKHPSKIRNGRHKQKTGRPIYKPPKNIQEKIKKKALVDTVFTVSKS